MLGVNDISRAFPGTSSHLLGGQLIACQLQILKFSFCPIEHYCVSGKRKAHSQSY